MQTDALLLKHAQAGDMAAVETLLEQQQNRVYALCLRMMSGSRQDALDMAQEALLRVYRSLGSYKGEAGFSTWVYRLTANVCIDELRRRKRNSTVSMDVLRENGFEPPDKAPSPEQAAVLSEDSEELARAISLLPEDQRAAVLLRDVHGLSYEQVASALEVNMNTAKSRISRGRQKTRELLTQIRNNSRVSASK